MSTLKAFATRPAPAHIISLLAENNIELTCWTEQRNPTHDELVEILKTQDAFLNVSYGKLTKTFFQAFSHLKVVCTYSVGYDHIDIAAATEVGIPVCNTPGVVSQATADTALLLTLMATRRAQVNYHRILDNKWGFSAPMDHCGYDLTGKTVGIFGLGRIGAEYAKLCQGAYKMNVIYHNRNRNIELENELGAKYVSFEELLAQSDVLSVHAFASPENLNKFDYDAFGQMKPTSIFVNTARGSLVNEEDLVKALDEKKIFAAGLDVFKVEPLPADHIFRNNHDICMLPHIGTSTIETCLDMWDMSAKNLITSLHGKPSPTCLNPEVYTKEAE